LKIVHIFPAEKFTLPFIEFVNNNFSMENHFFLIYGNFKTECSLPQNAKCFKQSFKNIIQLENLLYSADKIILHSLLLNNKFLLLFLAQRWLLRKCYWTIWGADLYFHIYKDNSFKSIIRERLLKGVISKLGGVVTHIKGEYELAKLWYNVKGKYFYSFMYLSNVFDDKYVDKMINQKTQSDKTVIQIGNSADPTNNHIEILKQLYPIKEANIEIICPLSYGNPEYAKKVQEIGKEMYDDKFQPLVDFLPFETYVNILGMVDVAIFGHKRQQAIGNITFLLGLGKKVYIRDDINTWDFLKEHGLKVYNTNNIDLEKLLEKIPDEIRQKNMVNVKRAFSAEKLKEDLNKIFQS
jgi:dTDP-N-acetylfucosamine:lipid II N-acetylfucosaminyltransferase